MESPRSPKRRRILSSINPPEQNNAADAPRDPRRDRSMTPTGPRQPRRDSREPSINDEDGAKGKSDEADYGPREPKATKFRFKSSSSRSSRRRERDEDDEDDDRYRRHRHHRHRDEDGHDDESRSHRTRDRSRERDKFTERARHRRKHGDADYIRDGDNSSSQRSRRHHRHHHRHRRRRRSHPSRPDSAPEPENDPPLSPTTAFRESLFDAMADDEGAAYWESVYGQPIHIYAPPHTASGGTGAGGMLEQMTEDEYAAYVRQKMWEKTHAGLMEARARRQREQEEEREKAEERARVNREMERSLRRGEERRKRRGWRERWEKYLERWTVWESEGGKGTAGGGGGEDGDAGLLKEKIPWPIISSGGSTRGYGDEGVDGEAVRAFFVNGIGLEELGEKEFAAQLKEERVRWHPDKMQRRLGGKVDEKIMRDVTAIFQVVDALWNDTRKKSG